MPSRVKRPSLADVVVHPERLEILRAFEAHGPTSISELRTRVRPIARSSIYRHVRTLHAAGILRIVETKAKARGAPEAVYEIAENAPESIRLRGRLRSWQNLQRYLISIHAAQLAELESASTAGRLEGLFALRYSRVYLNRAEVREVRQMLERLKEFAGKPADGRTAFSLSVAVFPAVRTTAKARDV